MQFLQRKIYTELKNHLDKPEITLILGPRQAGKTTLMEKMRSELEIDQQATIFFNLDVIEDRQYFTSQHTLLDRINKTVTHRRSIVFIDEIQRLKNAGLFLKGLYDLKTPHKFVVSGSGSLELKADIIEPMTGRKKIFYCLPLSFTEFAANKLAVDFSATPSVLNTNIYERERLINEYLAFGGYPRVILAQTETEKTEVLAEIFRSYLERDIQLILNIKKEITFENLIKLLSRQVGNLINYNEITAAVGAAQPTVKKYLSVLEKTFVIKLIPPFFTNPRKELTKSPKVYFLDMGFLALAQGRLPRITPPIEGGNFENACLLRLGELIELDNIRFWRSSSGAEVDFVVKTAYLSENIPVEVKLSLGTRTKLGKSYISFINSYGPKQGYFYTKNTQSTVQRKQTTVHFLSYHYLPDL